MRTHLSVSAITLFLLSVIFTACNNDKTKTTDAPKTDSVAKAAPVAAASRGKLLGVWHDAAIHSEKGEQIAYELIGKDDKFYIQVITFTTINLKVNDEPPISPNASELTKNGDKYITAQDPTQTYEVHKDGDLLIYDSGELVAKCKKLL